MAKSMATGQRTGPNNNGEIKGDKREGQRQGANPKWNPRRPIGGGQIPPPSSRVAAPVGLIGPIWMGQLSDQKRGNSIQVQQVERWDNVTKSCQRKGNSSLFL